MFSLFIGHHILDAHAPAALDVGDPDERLHSETLPGTLAYELKPNMVFAVEPLVWVPDIEGGGGVRIEDMVLVTEGAPRILSRVEYEERLML